MFEHKNYEVIYGINLMKYCIFVLNYHVIVVIQEIIF